MPKFVHALEIKYVRRSNSAMGLEPVKIVLEKPAKIAHFLDKEALSICPIKIEYGTPLSDADIRRLAQNG